MNDRIDPADRSRRRLLALAAGAGAWLAVRPARAAPDDLAAAIRMYAGGADVRGGGVTLDVPELVDNGNSVPVTVDVDSPMTAADHVAAIAIFNERNPERDVARYTLGPRAGRARVSTRMRLATSQTIVAVARMSDGSYRSHAVDVVVVLAACIEGDV
ncbi:sulfur-oxidizing protein SoxY [Burkholderiales bacterium]|nr:sulfur-oxidizing protein SoxY [Burkholderiales bacterium]